MIVSLNNIYDCILNENSFGFENCCNTGLLLHRMSLLRPSIEADDCGHATILGSHRQMATNSP